MRLRVALVSTATSGHILQVSPPSINATVQYYTDGYEFLTFENTSNQTINISPPREPSENMVKSWWGDLPVIEYETPSEPGSPQVQHWDPDPLADYDGCENPSLSGSILRSSGEFGFDDLLTLRDLTGGAPPENADLLEGQFNDDIANVVLTPGFQKWNNTYSHHKDGYSLDLDGIRSVGRRLSDSYNDGEALHIWIQNIAIKIKAEKTMRLIAGKKPLARRQLDELQTSSVIKSVAEIDSLSLVLLDIDAKASVQEISEFLRELIVKNDSFSFIEPDTIVWALGYHSETSTTLYRCPHIEVSPAELHRSPFHPLVNFNDTQPDTECGRLSQNPNDPLWPLQWGPKWANIEQAWSFHRGDEDGLEDVIVCIIDTGVDYRHPDIAQNMWVNEAELHGVPGVDDDGNGYIDDIYGINALRPIGDPRSGDPLDDNSHGTHCAGVVAARGDNNLGVIGVNRRAKIMACKFLGSDGGGAVSNAVKCIDYAIQHKVRVLSNSWGGSGSRSLKDATYRSLQAGLLFIAAAGNQYQNNDVMPTFPANYGLEMDNVISVGSVDQKGLSPFSNFGLKSVHIAAPGSNILSTVRNGAYATLSGTSMACPSIAGLASLILSANPSLGYRDVIKAIRAGVKPMKELTARTIWGGMTDFDTTMKNVLGHKIIRPIPSWSPWLNAQISLGPKDVLKLPFAIYGLAVGSYRSSFKVMAKDPQTSTVLDNVNITWEVTVTTRPQLDTSNIPRRLILPTEPETPSIPAVIRLKQKGPDPTSALSVKLKLEQSSNASALLSTIPLDGQVETNISYSDDIQFMIQCLPGASSHLLVASREEGLSNPVETGIEIFCQDFQVRVVPDKLTSHDVDLLLTMVNSCEDGPSCISPPVSFMAHYVPPESPQIKSYKPRVWTRGLYWIDLRECVQCFIGAQSSLKKATSSSDDIMWTELTLSENDDGTVEYDFQKMRDFPFLDSSYDRIFINSNGWVSFRPLSGEFPLWEPRLHLNDRDFDAIAIYWTDLKMAKILVAESEDEVIIQWADAELFNDLKRQKFSLQLILTKSGNILLSYKDLVYEPNAQIGLRAGQKYRRIAPLDKLYGFLVGGAMLAYSPEEPEEASKIAFQSSNDSYELGVLSQKITTLQFKRPQFHAESINKSNGYIKILTSSPVIQQPLKVMRIDFTPDT